MFGLHAVKAAIKNPNRKIHELWISQNARAKIFSDYKIPKIPIVEFIINLQFHYLK